jgi:hypothetical protein
LLEKEKDIDPPPPLRLDSQHPDGLIAGRRAAIDPNISMRETKKIDFLQVKDDTGVCLTI